MNANRLAAIALALLLFSTATSRLFASDAPTHVEVPGIEHLVSGLHHFQSEVFAQDKKFYASLASGQSPSALFVTCSDSRLDPNLFTRSRPGSIFVLRNAGNLVPPYGSCRGGEAGTIEYAVKALGVRDIIVCGHTQCGAMKGLLDPSHLTELPAVAHWLSFADPVIRMLKERYPSSTGEHRLGVAIEENILVQMENIRSQPAVEPLYARRQLHLHGWLYQLETGRVLAYDTATGQFEPLTARSATAKLP